MPDLQKLGADRIGSADHGVNGKNSRCVPVAVLQVRLRAFEKGLSFLEVDGVDTDFGGLGADSSYHSMAPLENRISPALISR